jgi:hypothetical protein
MCQGTKRAAELASPIFVSQLRQHRSEVLLVFSCSIFFLFISTPAASLHFSFPFEWRRPSTVQSMVILACRPRDRSVCFVFNAGAGWWICLQATWLGVWFPFYAEIFSAEFASSGAHCTVRLVPSLGFPRQSRLWLFISVRSVLALLALISP